MFAHPGHRVRDAGSSSASDATSDAGFTFGLRNNSHDCTSPPMQAFLHVTMSRHSLVRANPTAADARITAPTAATANAGVDTLGPSKKQNDFFGSQEELLALKPTANPPTTAGTPTSRSRTGAARLVVQATGCCASSGLEGAPRTAMNEQPVGRSSRAAVKRTGRIVSPPHNEAFDGRARRASHK